MLLLPSVRPSGFTKLHMGLVVLVKVCQSSLIFYCKIPILCQSVPNFAGHVWQDWQISQTLVCLSLNCWINCSNRTNMALLPDTTIIRFHVGMYIPIMQFLWMLNACSVSASKQKSIYMDGVMSGIIFSTHQSSTSLPNLEVLKLRAVIPLVTIFDCLASPMWLNGQKWM